MMNDVKEEVPAKGKANEEARNSLKGSILKRRASLSEAEECFLHALLVEEPQFSNGNDDPHLAKKLEKASQVLNDDMLFSVPPADENQEDVSKMNANKTTRRPSILGLWQAHEDGVAPLSLVKRGSLSLQPPSGDLKEEAEELDQEEEKKDPSEDAEEDDDGSDNASDEEVRHEKHALEDGSSGSSWGEEDHRENYSSWEVLKNEYAEDFGFDYSDTGSSADDILDDKDSVQNTFRILGTSADDTSAQPHVLSPPLMDALMSFLPDNLRGENFWLKFSLVRDGASLETLKRYVRASKYTILAIETPTGEVFGSFTSSPWRHNLGFYGAAPAFVWKMRHSRRTKCYSLFDQAQLESEIDVYMYSGTNELVQACRRDELAVGGDDGLPNLDEEIFDELPDLFVRDVNSGFALKLDDDLLTGTSNPSPTFRNPSLCSSGKTGDTFEVSNLEIWTFTPAFDVKSAERLEMTKFFIAESIREGSCGYASDVSQQSSRSSQFSSQDLVQEEFYRRVGHDRNSEERRDRWQYLNMMGGTDGVNRGVGGSPRYGGP
jgi:hypothetical protein